MTQEECDEEKIGFSKLNERVVNLETTILRNVEHEFDK